MGIDQTPDLGFLCASLGCSSHPSRTGLLQAQHGLSPPRTWGPSLGSVSGLWWGYGRAVCFSAAASCVKWSRGGFCVFSTFRWPHLLGPGGASCHLGMEEVWGRVQPCTGPWRPALASALWPRFPQALVRPHSKGLGLVQDKSWGSCVCS